jgi:hypothetical protein
MACLRSTRTMSSVQETSIGRRKPSRCEPCLFHAATGFLELAMDMPVCPSPPFGALIFCIRCFVGAEREGRSAQPR